MSCSAVHLGIPVWWSHFVPVSVENRGKWFLGFFSWGRLSHHQQSSIMRFSSSSFWTEQRLYFVSPAECVWELVRMSISCASVVHFFCFSSVFFLQFACITLHLISRIHLTGGWSAIFTKRRGCAVCAVSPYRREITAHGKITGCRVIKIRL